MTLRLFYFLSLGACLAAFSPACSNDDSSGDGDGKAGANGSGDGDGDSGTTLDITSSGDSDSDSDSGDGGEGNGGPVCETASAAAELPPVYLAFAFDVSGSMGKLDQPRWWHDPEAKWQPVVEATTAFFTDSSSQGLSASMALFPAAADECEPESYDDPEVGMTELPSDAFSAAFADYEDEVGDPLAGGEWRGGTPTEAALSGVGTALDALRASNDEEGAEFAIVLVTDGLPQGCNADISGALQAAEDLYANGLPTYVIGIENPTTPPDEPPEGWDDWGNCDFGEGGGDTPCTPPDTLEALNELARVGGTEAAFLIDTGNPSATEDDFRDAIEQIRESSSACSVPIPENPDPDTSFDPEKVNVKIETDGSTMNLNYDPTCDEANSWHYDDPEDPEAIELCESTCLDLQANPDAELRVDFLCEANPDIIIR